MNPTPEPNKPRGSFFVRKQRIIAQFSFGWNMTFETREQAERAATAFVAAHPDGPSLKTIERRIP